MASSFHLEADQYDYKSNRFSESEIVASLKTRGFCTISNLFNEDTVAEVTEAVNFYYKHPAVAGVPGYTKVDYPKKLLSPGIVGPAVYDLMLNNVIISIIENVMDSACILAEANFKYDKGVNQVYFPMHSDFSVGWQKSKSSYKLTAGDLQEVIGVGIAIYLEDCDEGAFAYCDGTQKLLAPKGGNIAKYTQEEQEAILRSKVSCPGKKGDLVIFDDRGFHGPGHPSRKDRSVLLLDYYRVKTFGYCQVSPLLVRTSDINLTKFSKKQCSVLGLGSDYWVEPSEYMGARFKLNRLYPLINCLIENAYRFSFAKLSLKNKLRNLLRKPT